MNTIKHISMAPDRYPHIFLVSQDKVGFLVNCEPSDGSFGFICPCCFFPEERRLIMGAVTGAMSEGTIEGKVRWCCHKSDMPYGDSLGEYHPLKQEVFCAGSANAGILPELKLKIQEEAVRVSR